MAEDLCTYDVADGIATLTFNRPDSMNGMTGNMEVAYYQRLTQAQEDDDVAACLIHHQLSHRHAGATPLFLVPTTAGDLVQQLYQWGARNCETHVSQVRGKSLPTAGVLMPTFMPETG